jgi:hypothetical protein
MIPDSPSTRDQVSGHAGGIHLHLWDVFNPENHVEQRCLFELAQVMAETWRVRATKQFPDREIFTEALDDADDVYGPTVYLWSKQS